MTIKFVPPSKEELERRGVVEEGVVNSAPVQPTPKPKKPAKAKE